MPRKGEPYFEEVNDQGFPALVDNRRPPVPPPPKIEVKPRKPRRLDPTPKQIEAKANFIKMGATPDVKRAAGETAGYHPNAAVRGVNSTLRPIVGILEDKGVDDEYIAETIVNGLKAMHPMAPKQKDHNVRHKFVREVNTLRNNYPPKEIKSEEKKIVLMITGEDVRQSQSVDAIREEHDRDSI